VYRYCSEGGAVAFYVMRRPGMQGDATPIEVPRTMPFLYSCVICIVLIHIQSVRSRIIYDSKACLVLFYNGQRSF
jgi:hypothetical protein